jgi:hypothetical protein
MNVAPPEIDAPGELFTDMRPTISCCRANYRRNGHDWHAGAADEMLFEIHLMFGGALAIIQ